MKNGLVKQMLAGSGIVSLVGTVLLGSGFVHAGDVDYRGEIRAVSVCQAVVEDNPALLKATIRRAARDNRLTTVAPVGPESFRCNGQTLKEFAEAQRALHVASYLDGRETEFVAQK